jgi:hypothetical protein
MQGQIQASLAMFDDAFQPCSRENFPELHHRDLHFNIMMYIQNSL